MDKCQFEGYKGELMFILSVCPSTLISFGNSFIISETNFNTSCAFLPNSASPELKRISSNILIVIPLWLFSILTELFNSFIFIKSFNSCFSKSIGFSTTSLLRLNASGRLASILNFWLPKTLPIAEVTLSYFAASIFDIAYNIINKPNKSVIKSA